MVIEIKIVMYNPTTQRIERERKRKEMVWQETQKIEIGGRR